MKRTLRSRTIATLESLSPAWSHSLVVMGLLAASVVGCKTVDTKATPPTSTTMMPTTDSSPENPFATKTEFTREMTPDQRFNVLVELGRVYETQGNFEAAVAEYEKAVEIGKTKGSILGASKLGPDKRALVERRLGGAYDRMGRFTQAEIHYRKALELAPKDAKVWNDAGYSYYLQSRLSDAEQAFKTAEKLDPNNPRVLTNLGLALAAAGKTEDALQALSRAGGPAIGHANLGYILAALGKTDEARSHYQNALTLQPQLIAAQHAIAQLDSQAKGRTDEMLAAASGPAGPTPPPAVAAAPVPPPVPSTLPEMVVSEPRSTSAESKNAKTDAVSRTAVESLQVKPASTPKPPAVVSTPSASLPKPVASPPKPAVSPPKPQLQAPKIDPLDDLPELPPMLNQDAKVSKASATIEESKPTKPGQPRRDSSLFKAMGTSTQPAGAMESGDTHRDPQVTKASSSEKTTETKAKETPRRRRAKGGTYRPITNPIPATPW